MVGGTPAVGRRKKDFFQNLPALVKFKLLFVSECITLEVCPALCGTGSGSFLEWDPGRTVCSFD